MFRQEYGEDFIQAGAGKVIRILPSACTAGGGAFRRKKPAKGSTPSCFSHTCFIYHCCATIASLLRYRRYRWHRRYRRYD
jgi:hypothetical protein